MGKGTDRADLGDGVVILNAPTPSASGWGVGVGKDLCREGAICFNNCAELRLPNSQPAWGDNI